MTGEFLERLSKEGVRDIAFELPSDAQKATNEYLASNRGVEERGIHAGKLAEGMGIEVPPIGGVSLGRAMEHVPQARAMYYTLDKAAALGMNVHCVDKPSKDFAKVTAEVEQLSPDSSPAEQTKSADISDRNRVMANNIAKIKPEGAGVAYVGGYLHCGHGKDRTSLDDRLQDKGFNTVSASSMEGLQRVDEFRCREGGTELSGPDIMVNNPKEFHREIKKFNEASKESPIESLPGRSLLGTMPQQARDKEMAFSK